LEIKPEKSTYFWVTKNQRFDLVEESTPSKTEKKKLHIEEEPVI
jgi:hypothetical protein